jgi:hypothetical protein
MRRSFITTTARVTVLAAAIAFPIATRAQVCASPNANTTAQLDEIKGLLSNTHASSVSARSSLGLIGVDTTQMTLVTSDSVCARVNTAVMNVGEPKILPRLVVYRLGATRFGAFHPVSNYTVVFIIDDAYSILTLIGVEGSGISRQQGVVRHRSVQLPGGIRPHTP